MLPTRRTYLSVWAPEPGAERPDASILNVNPGAVRAASTYAPLSETARFRLFNDAGSMHVVMDVAGTLDWYPSLDDLSPFPAVGRPAGVAEAAPGSGTWPADPRGRTARPGKVSTRARHRLRTSRRPGRCHRPWPLGDTPGAPSRGSPDRRALPTYRGSPAALPRAVNLPRSPHVLHLSPLVPRGRARRPARVRLAVVTAVLAALAARRRPRVGRAR